MHKKKTSLAGFGSVANTENITKTRNEIKDDIEPKNNVNNNIENNDITDTYISTNDSIDTETNIKSNNDFKSVIDSIIEVQKEKSKKIQISAYIDSDVHKLLEKFGKQHGKGAKSNLINELLRNALQ
jgi:hypothetical protein